MSSADGVSRATCRQRRRSVIAMSSGSTDGAHSRNTVDGGGIGTTFSGALARTLGEPVGVFDHHDGFVPGADEWTHSPTDDNDGNKEWNGRTNAGGKKGME